MKTPLLLVLFITGSISVVVGQTKARARNLRVPFSGVWGKFNAITDVPGVEVGFKTLISGSGKLVAGKGPVLL